MIFDQWYFSVGGVTKQPIKNLFVHELFTVKQKLNLRKRCEVFFLTSTISHVLKGLNASRAVWTSADQMKQLDTVYAADLATWLTRSHIWQQNEPHKPIRLLHTHFPRNITCICDMQYEMNTYLWAQMNQMWAGNWWSDSAQGYYW